MMTKAATILRAMIVLLTGYTKEQIYRAFYEGTKTQQRLEDVPDRGSETMSYDQYETIRKDTPTLQIKPR